MGQKDTAAVRDAYVEAFNSGDLSRVEALLHDDAVYRWELEGRAEKGRAAVMKLYEMGHRAFQGRGRLSAVEGTDDQAVWWQPEESGLKAMGLQTIRAEEGLLVEISDSHSPQKVGEAAKSAKIPR